MTIEEVYRWREEVSKFLEMNDDAGNLSVRDVSFSADSAKKAVHDLVGLGYAREVGRSRGLPDNQFRSATPYRIHMCDRPAQATEDLQPEKPEGFNPQTLPQDLSRPELERVMDWASGQLAMMSQRRPPEPELKDGPSVVVFTRIVNDQLHTHAAIRGEGGLWSITGMIVRVTWDNLLDRIESGSTGTHDAMSTLQSMDLRSQPM